MVTKPQELVVIGAGPAGLTAALEAARSGLKPLVLEEEAQVGGIARTEIHRGYRFDIGGHRFFTRVPEIQRLWEEILGDDFRLTQRLSRIYHRRKYYRYPLNIWETLNNLGFVQSTRAVVSFSKARLSPRRTETTFEHWVTNRFGSHLYETFFKTYTEKVWGIPCREIQAEWASQRIKDLSLASAIRQALWPGAVTTPHSLIEQFHYPRLGPGMMWECFREKVEEHGGAVRTRQEVIEIRYEASRVTSVLLRPAEGGLTTVPLCQVISTMPLDELILRMRPAPPPVVVEAARALKYRDFILVGLVLRRPSLFADNWLYIHSSRVRVGRIQNFGNWSCDLVPNTGTSSLGMEYFCNRGDAIWTTPDDDLVRLASEEIEVLGLAKRTDLLWGTVIRQPKAYPVYDAHYQRHLTTIRGWLATLTNFQTIGRNGQHRYNNMDHSMLTGLAAVHRLQGQAADPWEINVEESYHEQLDTLKSGAP